ncbi:MAG: TIGR01620 family protein [Nitratireductor sp.]|nr:TIGR01620 family protein [Nitratireductor sp.]
MTKDTHRKPRAIRLDEAGTSAQSPTPPETERQHAPRKPRAMPQQVVLEDIPDEAANAWPEGSPEDLTPPPPPPAKRGFSWLGLLLAGLGGLVSLAIALAVDQLVRDLYDRNEWLGWLAIGLSGLVVLAAIAIAARETIALSRMRAIHDLQDRVARAHADDDIRLARSVITELVSIYGRRADTARGRAMLAEQKNEIIDGADLVTLAERGLMAPLDREATAMVMNAAKRVSIVTAVSPRALIDIGFVLIENMRLIRRLSQLYGGRPGTIGFLRLTRDVFTHLATTGAIALGDSLIQQIVGHGLAARLSAKLGEGVVNGLLTARIGIAAIDVCRPMPFIGEKRPGVSDFLSELVRLNAPKSDRGRLHVGESAKPEKETKRNAS